MSQSGDTLHLNGVHLLQRVVQNTRRVDDLPSQVLVIQMTNEQRLGGEGVRLDIHVRAGDLVNEGRFADVGVSTDDEGSGIGVDGGETGDMLTDLLEVRKRVFLAAHDRSHSGGQMSASYKLEERISYRPRAAFLSCLHRYKLSPNLSRRT